MPVYVIARAHVDKDGNHRRFGDAPLELSEAEAEPFVIRGQLMTPEVFAAKRQEIAARIANVDFFRPKPRVRE
jgi:hypothetical protein